MLRHISRRVANSAVAEDLTSQTFLNAWQSMDRFLQVEGRSFLAWLLHIANNLVVDNYRRTRHETDRAEEVDRMQAVRSPEEHALDKAISGELQCFIERLKPEQRLILTLRMVDGLRYAEIGELVGKSEGAVRVIHFRALASLRRSLGTREIA